MNVLQMIRLRILKEQRKIKALRAQYLKSHEITG